MPFVGPCITTPLIVTVEEALPVTVPPVAEVNVTEHWPLAFVRQVERTGRSRRPRRSPFVSVTLHGRPAPTGASPEPVSCKTVTVNVCGWPTSFVAFGAMTIAAFTHSLAASALSPACASPVSRCNETPPTATSVDARTVVCPVAFDVIVNWQSPVVPTVAH